MKITRKKLKRELNDMFNEAFKLREDYKCMSNNYTYYFNHYYDGICDSVEQIAETFNIKIKLSKKNEEMCDG